MQRRVFTAFVAVLICAVLSGPSADRRRAFSQDKPDNAPKSAIDKLIARLGSESFATREEAKEALLKLGVEAIPHLKKAAQSSDLEMARRAQFILEQIERMPREASIAKRIAQATSEGIDLFVERMVAKGKAMTDSDWAVVDAILQEVVRKAEKLGYAKHQYPEYTRLPIWKPGGMDDFFGGIFLSKKRYLGEYDWSKLRIFEGSLVLCTGSIESRFGFGTSAVFTNGNVKVGDVSGRGIVVCDGGVEASIVNSLVVCNGPIKGHFIHGNVLFSNSAIIARGQIMDNIIISGQEIQLNGQLFDNKMFSKGKVRLEGMTRNNLVKEDQPQIPEFLRFFDPAQLGGTVSAVMDNVRVVDVKKDSLFWRSGFRSGDIIAEIDQAKTDSYEDFRKVLRRKVVEGRATFVIRRGDKVIPLSVDFGE